MLVFMTDPEVEVPLGDHNRSTFIGEVPYARIEAGDLGIDFKRSTMVRRRGRGVRPYSFRRLIKMGIVPTTVLR